MTGHRAAWPVTVEVSGLSDDDDFGTASRPESMRQASTWRSAMPLSGGLSRHAPDQSDATRVLSPRPESVKAGREFARDTLLDWGLASVTDVAELVISELLTNALRHGISSAHTGSNGQSVRLRLLAQAPFVMCMVTDPGPEIPVLCDSGPGAETGRGLRVVEACSVQWGWHLLDGGGKVVWALLR